MASSSEFNQNAEIIGVGEDGKVLIKVKDAEFFRNIKEIIVAPVIKEKISQEQRRMIWAIIGEITEWNCGSRSSSEKREVNEDLKMLFCEENSIEEFSLSSTNKKIANAYQNFLIDFVVSNGIQTNMNLGEYTDNQTSYIYSCLSHKKCCVCGLPSDMHHTDTNHSKVGMGRNRKEIVHEGLLVLPLCRKHHTEIHTMPEQEFIDKYHLGNPVKLDKFLCDVYGLNTYVE